MSDVLAVEDRVAGPHAWAARALVQHAPVRVAYGPLLACLWRINRVNGRSRCDADIGLLVDTVLVLFNHQPHPMKIVTAVGAVIVNVPASKISITNIRRGCRRGHMD